MKFCQEWRAQILYLPPYLRHYCFNYKRWKKYSKDEHSFEIILQRLHRECSNVEKIIKPGIMDKFLNIILREKHDHSPEDLLKFLNINQLCIRKICKRLDKRYSSKVFKKWLDIEKHNGQFTFLNRDIITKLELSCQKQETVNMECPICMEDVDEKRHGLITRCGHIICVDCALHMIDMSGKHGHIENMFRYALYYNRKKCICPLCRDKYAFYNMTVEKNIWPEVKEYNC